MISITPAAVEKFNEFIKKRGNTYGIRVGVSTAGCSGMRYVLEYIDVEPEADFYYECDGIKIFVEQNHLVYLHGLTIDWQKVGLNEGFSFINPNERSRCGCGESFRV